MQDVDMFGYDQLNEMLSNPVVRNSVPELAKILILDDLNEKNLLDHILVNALHKLTRQDATVSEKVEIIEWMLDPSKNGFSFSNCCYVAGFKPENFGFWIAHYADTELNRLLQQAYEFMLVPMDMDYFRYAKGIIMATWHNAVSFFEYAQLQFLSIWGEPDETNTVDHLPMMY